MIRRLTYRPIRFSRRTRPNFLKPLRKRGRPSFKELEEREKIDLPEERMYGEFDVAGHYEKLLNHIKTMCPSDGKAQIKSWKRFVGIPNENRLEIEKPENLESLCPYPELVHGKDIYPEDHENFEEYNRIGHRQYLVYETEPLNLNELSLKQVLKRMNHYEREIFLLEQLSRLDVPYDIFEGIKWPSTSIHDISDLKRDLRSIYNRQNIRERPRDFSKIRRKSAPVINSMEQRRLLERALEIVEEEIEYRQRVDDAVKAEVVQLEISMNEAEQYENSINELAKNEESWEDYSHQSLSDSESKIEIDPEDLKQTLENTEKLFLKAIVNKNFTIIDFYFQLVNIERNKYKKLFRNYAYEADLTEMSHKLEVVLSEYNRILDISREFLQMDKSLYQTMRKHFNFSVAIKDKQMNPTLINGTENWERTLILKEKVEKTIEFSTKSFHQIRRKYKILLS